MNICPFFKRAVFFLMACHLQLTRSNFSNIVSLPLFYAAMLWNSLLSILFLYELTEARGSLLLTILISWLTNVNSAYLNLLSLLKPSNRHCLWKDLNKQSNITNIGIVINLLKPKWASSHRNVYLCHLNLFQNTWDLIT